MKNQFLRLTFAVAATSLVGVGTASANEGDIAIPDGILADFGDADGWKLLTPRDGWVLQWQFTTDYVRDGVDFADGAEVVAFEFTTDSAGWIGVGFGEMTNGDFVIGAVDDDTGETSLLGDYYTSVIPFPGEDNSFAGGGEDNILEAEVEQMNGMTTIRFVRLANTGDSRDRILDQGSEIKLLLAASGSDNLGYHFTNRVAQVIQL